MGKQKRKYSKILEDKNDAKYKLDKIEPNPVTGSAGVRKENKHEAFIHYCKSPH